jgi:hypothetical protein
MNIKAVVTASLNNCLSGCNRLLEQWICACAKSILHSGQPISFFQLLFRSLLLDSLFLGLDSSEFGGPGITRCFFFVAALATAFFWDSVSFLLREEELDLEEEPEELERLRFFLAGGEQ